MASNLAKVDSLGQEKLARHTNKWPLLSLCVWARVYFLLFSSVCLAAPIDQSHLLSLPAPTAAAASTLAASAASAAPKKTNVAAAQASAPAMALLHFNQAATLIVAGRSLAGQVTGVSCELEHSRQTHLAACEVNFASSQTRTTNDN